VPPHAKLADAFQRLHPLPGDDALAAMPRHVQNLGAGVIVDQGDVIGNGRLEASDAHIELLPCDEEPIPGSEGGELLELSLLPAVPRVICGPRSVARRHPRVTRASFNAPVSPPPGGTVRVRIVRSTGP
jgi:hypothetical protein